MAEEQDDKKHDATDKKWADAAEKGQIPRSTDLGAAASLLAGSLVLVFGYQPMQGALGHLVTKFLHPDSSRLQLAEAVMLGSEVMFGVGQMLLFPLGALLLSGIVVGLAQSQGRIATSALEPDPSRLNPIEGFQQKYFSSMPLMELGKGLGKLGLLSGMAVMALWNEVGQFPAMSAFTPTQLLSELTRLGWKLVLSCLPLIVLIAVADYAYSYWRLSKQLMLTDKELKDEMKNQEGDPYMKAKRRAMGRQIASGSMLAAVADAEVVITNPTHFAIALRYKQGQDFAPIVVARGVDALALKIRAEALKQGVARIENRPLARALYKQTRVGDAIPEDLFTPVARVLAVIYRRRAARAAAG